MDRWRGPSEKKDLTEEEYVAVLGVEQFKCDLSSLVERGVIDRLPRRTTYQTAIQAREWEEDPLLIGDHRIIIFNGVLALYDDLSALSQLRIYLNTDPELRWENKKLRLDIKGVDLARNHPPLAERYARNADIHLELSLGEKGYCYAAYQ
jgi:uridine kinase